MFHIPWIVAAFEANTVTDLLQHFNISSNDDFCHRSNHSAWYQLCCVETEYKLKTKDNVKMMVEGDSSNRDESSKSDSLRYLTSFVNSQINSNAWTTIHSILKLHVSIHVELTNSVHRMWRLGMLILDITVDLYRMALKQDDHFLILTIFWGKCHVCPL